jgi:hypothetical protein
MERREKSVLILFLLSSQLAHRRRGSSQSPVVTTAVLFRTETKHGRTPDLIAVPPALPFAGALIAAALNASKVLFPVEAALIEPTIPCWQCEVWAQKNPTRKGGSEKGEERGGGRTDGEGGVRDLQSPSGG